MSVPFYQCITDFIFLEDKPGKADIIFVPGGNYPEAARHAAQLYLEGYAPYIMPSGRYSITAGKLNIPGYDSEFEYLRGILLEHGVPDDAILKEDQATYTYQNAIFSKEAVRRQGLAITKGILCCQAFHARRSWMYYQEQFPKTQFLICPVVTRNISKENWYKTEAGIDTVLGEVERCGSQFHEIMRQHMRDEE